MPRTDLRLTRPVQGVLDALIARPSLDHHGTDLHVETGLTLGAIYPVLAKLESLQWVEGDWEEPRRHEQGFPRRRKYRLTPNGLAMARSALAGARTQAPTRAGHLRPVGETS